MSGYNNSAMVYAPYYGSVGYSQNALQTDHLQMAYLQADDRYVGKRTLSHLEGPRFDARLRYFFARFHNIVRKSRLTLTSRFGLILAKLKVP